MQKLPRALLAAVVVSFYPIAAWASEPGSNPTPPTPPPVEGPTVTPPALSLNSSPPSASTTAAGTPTQDCPEPQVSFQCCDPPPHHHRWWVSAEYLAWWIKDSHIPTATFTGPFPALPTLSLPLNLGPSGLPALAQPGRVALFGREDVDNEERSGGRFSAGYWFDDDHVFGVEASYFFLASRSVRAMTALDGSVDPFALPPVTVILTDPPPTPDTGATPSTGGSTTPGSSGLTGSSGSGSGSGSGRGGSRPDGHSHDHDGHGDGDDKHHHDHDGGNDDKDCHDGRGHDHGDGRHDHDGGDDKDHPHCRSSSAPADPKTPGQGSTTPPGTSPLLASSTFVLPSGGTVLSAFPGTTRSVLTSRLQGAEANGLMNLTDGDWYRVDLLGGFRWMQLKEGLGIFQNDSINVTTSGLAGQPNDITSLSLNMELTRDEQFSTQNNFYGGQVAARAEFTYQRIFVNVLGNLGLGDMHEQVTIVGYTTTTGSQTVTTASGATQTTSLAGTAPGWLAQASNIGSYSRDRFAVVPEARVSVGYQVTENLRLAVGYTFLYASTVVRPGDQIDPVSGADHPAFAFHGTDFWAQGLDAQVQVRY